MEAGAALAALGEPAVKGFRHGSHRLVAPEETVARLRPSMPAMGITRVANVTGLDRIGIPVVMVYRPNARGLVCAQGKGASLAGAKASGLMEAIETHHAERISLPLAFGSYSDLRRTHRLVDVTAVAHPVDSAFHPELPLSWIEGHDLLRQEPVWVPFELVTRDYTVPLPPGSGCFASSCNGLASGNHLLEAISHGICELVERDAATLMGLAGAEAHGAALLRLDTVDDPVCRETLDKYERAGFAVGAWEMTSDIGIPAFVCRIRDRGGEPSNRRIAAGFGCHPDRSIALLRALNEAAQNRLTAIAGSLDDVPVADGGRDAAGEGGEEREDPWFDLRRPLRSFHDVATWEAERFDEDVAWELRCLERVGVERVVVVDLTKPEFALPVVRVVIPGLECAILYAGRYALGRRARALLERSQ
jgi:ribosomal protein S12 methylthiotransferase accessory factor